MAISSMYPWLVADIGGTNARFGMVFGPGVRVSDIMTLRCAEYAGPETAATAYLDRVKGTRAQSVKPAAAAFAVATPVEGTTIKLTNSAWVLSLPDVERALGTHTLRVYNDFEALALSLPRLLPEDYALIGPHRPNPSQPMAVLGPGTGLGVAAAIPMADRWVAVSGEGGHATLCAADDFEADVLRVVRRRHPHVSAERVLSGMGLPSLYAAIAEVRGIAASAVTAEDITRNAVSGSDPISVAAMDTFCAMLGTFAGNVALTLGARGGVFVAGGILPKLGDYLARSRFRERFEAKGRFAGYMSGIATVLVTAPYAALNGAAQAIANEMGL